jgi:hypothetical protein
MPSKKVCLQTNFYAFSYCQCCCCCCCCTESHACFINKLVQRFFAKKSCVNVHYRLNVFFSLLSKHAVRLHILSNNANPPVNYKWNSTRKSKLNYFCTWIFPILLPVTLSLLSVSFQLNRIVVSGRRESVIR